MSEQTLAGTLGAFVAKTHFEDLPKPIVDKAKRHILDTLGVALAGATSEEAERTQGMLAETEAAGPSPWWGTPHRLAPRSAALVNGIAAHAYELDDTGGCDHSGAVVLPAAIAALDVTKRSLSGKDLITAVVLGYDLGRRVLEGFGGYKQHNEAGWHSTGTCGTFGAAAAVAHLLGSDAKSATNALGLAGSLSSGLWAFIHDGAMAKRVHAGRAAESGLLAGLLASRGVTGPAHIFADKWGGFLKTYAHGPVVPDALTRDLGRTWRMSIAAIKPYASCRDTHCAVDAVARLVERHKLAASDIARVHVRINSFLNGMVGGKEAATMPAAQMSLPYAVSARIVTGSASLSAYSEARRKDPAIRAMIERVTMDLDETVPSSDKSSVAFVLKDGRRVEEPTRIALGSPENPLSDAGLIAKFDELAGLVLAPDRRKALADRVMTLETEGDARAVARLLATAA